MKIRIKGNSIRLRLGRSEVRRLVIEGTVEETTIFGPARDEHLSYAICASAGLTAVTASFAGRRVVIGLPRHLIDQWASTDQVGIEARQRNGNDNELLILIEKDFECIDAPAGESREDAFPNPQLLSNGNRAGKPPC